MKKTLLFLFTILALFAFISCDNSVDYPFDDDVPAVETPEMVPLTFEFLKDGRIEISNKPENMVYSRNSGPKQEVEGNIIKAEAGDRIRLFATRTSATEANPLQIKATSECYVYGNVMSLIDENDFADKDSVFDYAFYRLFSNSDIRIHSSKKLVLPATTMEWDCYGNMFQGCTSLTTAPALPATTLAHYCYGGMFKDCSSLKTAPALSATTLADRCYQEMFSGCSSLTTAPALPAMSLDEYCYYLMFNSCTNLLVAPELPATNLYESCYKRMFYYCENLSSVTCLATNIPVPSCTEDWLKGVSSSGTFTKASSMNDWETGESGIPSGWTVIDQ